MSYMSIVLEKLEKFFRWLLFWHARYAKIPDKRLNSVLPGLWLRLPNSVTSFLFSNLYIGLKSMNALNTKFFLLPTKLLPHAQPTYLHSLISVQPLVLVLLVPHLLSPSVNHLDL